MDAYPQLAPAVSAVLFLTLAAAIAWWQGSRAPVCARHHRHAGHAAWALVALCAAAGAALLLSLGLAA